MVGADQKENEGVLVRAKTTGGDGRFVAVPAGEGEPTVELRVRDVSRSFSSPAEIGDCSCSVAKSGNGGTGGGAGAGIEARRTSSCNALMRCHVLSRRPTDPNSNSLMNKLFWSIASRTSPLISWSTKTSQCALSTPISSRYSATRVGDHALTSSSVYSCCSSSSVSAPAM
jgi:hypothetical protein